MGRTALGLAIVTAASVDTVMETTSLPQRNPGTKLVWLAGANALKWCPHDLKRLELGGCPDGRILTFGAGGPSVNVAILMKIMIPIYAAASYVYATYLIQTTAA
mmetsp:Transcript_37592/g.49543  ORF Transcript_37592/g.49543 Transcript_37592/m.49543 type:complete len:104 (+) Transcript_37592:388-699(+)